MKNKYKWVIGDWSDDGHGKSQNIIFETNHDIANIQVAYIQSCKLTGVAFHHGPDEGMTSFPEIKYRILEEYDDPSIPDEVIEVFKSHGLCREYSEIKYLSPSELGSILCWFISLSLDDFKYKIIKDEVLPINGWWGKLNHQFGYGLFD